MFSRLSRRDAFGHPIKYRSAGEAGLLFQYNDEDTVLYLDGSLTDTALGNDVPVNVWTDGDTPIIDGAITLNDGYFYLAADTITDHLKPDQEWTVDLLITPSSTMVTAYGQTLSCVFGYDDYNWSGAIYYSPTNKTMSAYSVASSTTASVFELDEKQLLSIEYYNDNGTRHFAIYRNGQKLVDKIHTMVGSGLNVGIPMYFSISSAGNSQKFRGKYHNVRISKVARYGGQNFTPPIL